MTTDWTQWIAGIAFTVTWGLLGWAKSVYDRRIEKLEDYQARWQIDSNSTHISLGQQSQVISERVTRLEGTISATLDQMGERLTRIEGILDAMMRAGFNAKS